MVDTWLFLAIGMMRVLLLILFLKPIWGSF